jgi:hypothetical protein
MKSEARMTCHPFQKNRESKERVYSRERKIVYCKYEDARTPRGLAVAGSQELAIAISGSRQVYDFAIENNSTFKIPSLGFMMMRGAGVSLVFPARR